MIGLKDAMQSDFDRTQLDTATDATLYTLLKKTETAITGWQLQEQPLESHELVWYNSLRSLADAIRNTINRRYGCND